MGLGELRSLLLASSRPGLVLRSPQVWCALLHGTSVTWRRRESCRGVRSALAVLLHSQVIGALLHPTFFSQPS